MIVKKVSEKVVLRHPDMRKDSGMLVKVSEQGITCYNQYGGKDFRFIKSKPEMLKMIGECLIEASKLSLEPKVEKKVSRGRNATG